MAARRHRCRRRLLEPGAPAGVVARIRGLVFLRAWIPRLRQPAAAPGRCAALHPRQSCARFDLRAGGCAGLSGRLRRARPSGARPGHDDGDAGATGSPAGSNAHAGRSGAAWCERLRSIAARAGDRRANRAARGAGMERPGTHPFQLPRLQLAPGRRSGDWRVECGMGLRASKRRRAHDRADTAEIRSSSLRPSQGIQHTADR